MTSAASQRRIRAVFARGGTSRALLFHRRDLPADPVAWDPIFLAALGSPDPAGRQLDGLGGGISSLSKVAIVGSPTRPDADVDYTFGQVEVTRPFVDYSGNCGNLSSAIGPFAIDEGLVAAREPETLVRGVLAVAASIRRGPGGAPVADKVTVYRTARRLMEGFVCIPA